MDMRRRRRIVIHHRLVWRVSTDIFPKCREDFTSISNKDIMRRATSFIVGGIAIVGLAVSASAQTTTQTGVGKGGSPHVKSVWNVGAANITIEYGRPYLKGRAESTMMPAGQPWRTGADEATVINFNKPLKIGTLSLAAGSYTINTIPGPKEWQLVIGKLSKPGQWGVPYDQSLEIGKTPMKLGKTKAPVEQVTYVVDTTPTGATLRIEWGTQSATVPITIGK
jgi:hypothetical protein